MNLIGNAIKQPVSVAVGVLLVVLAGFIALGRIPIQLTPNVEDTVIAVITRWEGASPLEVEQEIVDTQEDKLQGIAGVKAMTSTSQPGVGTIRLEFAVGTSKESALREVSDKLREVSNLPANADEPVIEASDPESRDYISWIVFSTTDPELDVRTLFDFADDRIKPALERIDGMSEIGVLGGREREVQIRFDPVAAAQHGVGVPELVAAVQGTNRNMSAGALAENKSDVRLRLVSQYTSVEDVERTVALETGAGPVLVGDLATVVETYKEPTSFVRSRGQQVIAINAQKEVGANVMAVMNDLKQRVIEMNEPGGLLETEARRLGLDGGLFLEMVYDQTIYINDALALVQSNIWLGGAIAICVLLLFLRSIRSSAIIALAIPISVVGAIVVMVGLGRSINVISLAGMAFAVGMVVDNAIVVLENIYRHLEQGKPPRRAALDGAREVFGAVLASTLTTVVVFVPILLISEEAGQLFRDIALAIVAAVVLSLVVALTVIPTSAARILKPKDPARPEASRGGLSGWIARLVWWLSGSVVLRVVLVAAMTAASLYGTWRLLPPSDYLPQGNRNLIFGLLVPPPGYNIDQLETLAERIETTIRPYWEASGLEPGSAEREDALAGLTPVPVFDFASMSMGEPIVPVPVDNYFAVSFDGIMFHGGIAEDATRAVDLIPLFSHATRGDVAPGVIAFAFQVPLFQLGGFSGSAVKINFSGDDLNQVSAAAGAVYGQLAQKFGPFTVQPDPANFNLPGPELSVRPDLVRLGEVGVTPEQLGSIVRSLGDGAFIGEYRVGGQAIDLKLIAAGSLEPGSIAGLGDTPLHTPRGGVVPLSSLARLERTNAAPQINRSGRQRSVTLLFTAPPGLPLEAAVEQIGGVLGDARAAGMIPPSVSTAFTGSASKLAAVRSAMLGDGTLAGILSSSLVLALLVVYLLMCVLFQSFVLPLIILFSVPLATLGGFAALFGVYKWSQAERYMPVQNLDVLTMLGFVILIGIVVNNAILIVHQTLNFMRGEGGEEPLAAREAIAESVRSRVRPIFMGTLTSVGGMAPLVFMPGSGSELYRGLGSVVVGGLLVSTLFTLFLVPMLLSLSFDFARLLRRKPRPQPESGPAREGSQDGARRSPGGGLPAGTGAVLLVALSFGLLASCRSRDPRPQLESVARGVALGVLETLGPEDADAYQPRVESSRVDAIVGERAAELEALGGSATWRDIDPVLESNLLGEAQELAAVSLREVVLSAAEHNLGLRLARVATEVDANGVIVEEAAFDPVFFANGDYQRSREPVAVPVLGGIQLGVNESATERAAFEGGVKRRLGSGGSLSLSSFVERFDNETPGIQFLPNPAWRSGLSATLTQPLLRGAGDEVNQAGIRLAETRREAARYQLEADLLTVIATTEAAWHDLAEAWDRLRIQERLLNDGQEVTRVLGERQSFDARASEVSDALATVEQRRTALVRARRLVRAASDRLKSLLDDPSWPVGGEVLLEPSRDPAQGLDGAEPEFAFRMRDAVSTALGSRPELRQALLAIEDARVRAALAANQMRPLLDLETGVNVVGQDGGFRRSWEETGDLDFASWFLGLSFELPAGNRAARAEERQARLRARASLLAYEAAVRNIVLEVKDALRNLETSWKLIGAARSFRLAQTENLRALGLEEIARRELTPEFLNLKFQRQERLAAAQLEELEAHASYRRALAAYRRAIGTGLGFDRLQVTQ